MKQVLETLILNCLKVVSNWERSVQILNLGEINEFVQQFLWLEFELIRINPQKVELHGFIDEASKDKIIITFSSVHMVCATISFTYEGKGTFISLAEKEQFISINKAYDVTFGNNVFLLSNTNIEGDMFIVAKQVEMELCRKT